MDKDNGSASLNLGLYIPYFKQDFIIAVPAVSFKLFKLKVFYAIYGIEIQPNPLGASCFRLAKTSNGCLLQDQSCDSDLVDGGAFLFVDPYTEWCHPVRKVLRSTHQFRPARK